MEYKFNDCLYISLCSIFVIFFVDEKIDSGGFGTVYRCNKTSSQPLAVKVIKDPKLTMQLFQEAFRARSFNSPYCVKVYDSIIIDNTVHIVMEYCSKSLAQYLKDSYKNKEVPKDVFFF